MTSLPGRPRVRLLTALALAVGLVGAAVALPADGWPGGWSGDRSGDARAGSLGSMYAAATQGRQATAADQASKNALSRGGQGADPADVADPTTAAQRREAAAAVARGRGSQEPRLTTVPVAQERRDRPQDRYAMAGGCYTLQTSPGSWVVRTAGGLGVSRTARTGAARFRFQATDLGQYLLYGERTDFLSTAGGRVTLAAAPSDDTVLTATVVGAGRARRFALAGAAGRALAVRDSELTTAGRASTFRLHTATGCPLYPEAAAGDNGVTGDPHAGVSSFQEVRGWVDAHTHGMAFEFLGGDVHCGRPWHRFGAPYALVDCPDHTATGGYGGALESVLSGKAGHDPVGWPTFKDWPAPESLTHEGTYWKWLERSWRGGQRMFTNLLVENNKLCELYPLKRNSCDDMDSVRLQARDMYAMQDYIDAQYGGPGKGFYRIVTSPFQARRVINAGKMAVVMGVETSVPFGCTMKLDVPACDVADIDRQLDELHALGVRQMELVNKFDNALAGVAGDLGQTGVAVNAANFLETGSFWDMRHCEPADGESHDNDQVALAGLPGASASAEQQDALFGAVADLRLGLGLPLLGLPVYPPPHHCNSRGLTTLGQHTIEALAARHMIFDPDHMSVKARATALDQVQALGYSGVVSSHSWSTPDAYARILHLGGFIAAYAGDSTGFVDKWRRHLGWADPRYYFGFGYGADMNGLGAQGDPRGADVANKVTYPFTGLHGVRIDRQTSGQRTWDVNVDGVAQYGLYPDWVQDVQHVAGADGPAIAADLDRGSEAYLQMWERADGIRADSCRNPGNRLTVRQVTKRVRPGMSTRAVMQVVGQPYTRLGTRYGTCARTSKNATVGMSIAFTPAGKVRSVRRQR